MLKLITTVFISLLIIVGVSYGASYYIATPAAENAKDADIQTIEKEVGEDFEIVLEANLTTGYQWTVEFDQNYLQLIERNYVPHFQENARTLMSFGNVEESMPSEEGRVQDLDAPDGARDIIDSSEESETEVLFGDGGQESFKFLTLKKGETEIKFSYERSWEKEPIEYLIYKVIIK